MKRIIVFTIMLICLISCSVEEVGNADYDGKPTYPDEEDVNDEKR